MTREAMSKETPSAEGGTLHAAPECAVVVSRLETIANGVVAISLSRTDGELFPEWSPGAHIDLLIRDNLERQYSLCGPVNQRNELRIAVLRESASRGGSLALHDNVREGDRLAIRGPRNHFPLVESDEYLFIAGGIGITPILPMLESIDRRGARWRLLYGGRTRSSMAFLEELSRYGDRVNICPEDEMGLLAVAQWIGAPRLGCVIYCCGPERLIDTVERQCADWPDDALHVERFKPAARSSTQGDKGFDVLLARRGISVHVAPGVTIADALDNVGVHIPRSCNEGTCGTCITKVLDGRPDHRDSFLRGRMRADGKRIMVCCSRTLGDRLVLDV